MKKEIVVENAFLPVGSVVMLKGATQPVIIIGIAPVENGKKKIWDYLAAPYPIGVISSDKNLLFNNDQIDKVLAEGFSTDEEKLFRMEMEKNIVAIRK